MSMFCYQCEQTAKGTGCTVRGVCGKSPEASRLMDLLVYGCKGLSMPAFVTPNILNVLVEKFNIMPIKTPDEDLKNILQ